MKALEMLAAVAIPFILLLACCCLLFGKKNYLACFLEGAEEGLRTAIGLLPTLVLLLSAISMLRASGATELLASVLQSGAERVGVPAELLPLLLTRPFSGSASSAMFSSLLDTVGADSFAALCGAVIMGSSDTVVYVISVYFSSVGIKKTAYAMPLAFAVMLFCILFSCFICGVWFK